MRKTGSMKAVLAFVLAMELISPTFAQRATVVRGIGTQTCKALIAADKQFALQASQWILGNMTGYFRQASDDASRTLGDAILVQAVVDICKKNADKTIDEATTIAISSLPVTDVKKPGEIK